jgi:hypothetical protein
MHIPHVQVNEAQAPPPTLKKYEVEDGLDVDFFAALQQLSEEPEPEPEESACLITNQPLNAFHIMLVCGHKFNYEPLYQEVLRQKGRLGMHNYYEKIGIHQIKCPYCRTLSNQLLPYIGPHPVIKRINGVNAPASMCMPGVECCHNGGSCAAVAFYEHDSNPYCLRHHNAVVKAASKVNTRAKKAKAETKTQQLIQCAAEIQTGKNKGKQCGLSAVFAVPPLCKKHSKCNVIVYQ